MQFLHAHYYTIRASKLINTAVSAFDVNVRSVYVSQTMGLSELQKFCIYILYIMDLPDPVYSDSYVYKDYERTQQ